ncbi:MAG: NAD(P)/FAD-dependent oxidoreductase [Methanomassiliicoccales archaeon]|nr:NAD(P)/FAD-dependent oxidoreductase [Methanomassiliicoccales archaeon]
MKSCDFLVVGGGPAGMTFAAEAAPHSHVVVLEEHRSVGIPVQCTGLVTPRVVQMVSARDTVINELKGAYFHFPEDEVVEVRSDQVKAVVLDRAAFDQRCADRAAEKGAEIRLGTSFLRAEIGGTVKCECREGQRLEQHQAKLLVGADGYKSKVASAVGLKGAKEKVRGIQVDLRHREDEQDMLEVHLGKKVAPGFFAWKIPCGDMTRVGVGSSLRHDVPMTYLTSLLRHLGFGDKERLSVISGLIPIGLPPETFADRALLIGDAAGQAKPLSGGGLYTGMVAARFGAKTALECLERGDFSSQSLSVYEERWRAEMGKELDRGYLIRKAFLRLSDHKLAELARALNREDVRSVLSEGDIDFPSDLASKVLRTAPSLVRFGPSLLFSLLPKGARNAK